MNEIIMEGIIDRNVLSFEYSGVSRDALPLCYGETESKNPNETLQLTAVLLDRVGVNISIELKEENIRHFYVSEIKNLIITGIQVNGKVSNPAFLKPKINNRYRAVKACINFL